MKKHMNKTANNYFETLHDLYTHITLSLRNEECLKLVRFYAVTDLVPRRRQRSQGS